ncbi:hypothetical protein CEXT_153081 [Caerostris extrusa]|uniref:Uncharacterized protein n=1 Tax=Caerostris extrusa TaxID=172846 RepID=A0AAV4MCE6_CAEEX|nr:hypothetical protein CEXT_153081 [Caerostris extrusa]
MWLKTLVTCKLTLQELKSSKKLRPRFQINKIHFLKEWFVNIPNSIIPQIYSFLGVLRSPSKLPRKEKGKSLKTKDLIKKGALSYPFSEG